MAHGLELGIGDRLSSAGAVVREPGRSEEHTSELQSPVPISYAVFCLKKKKNKKTTQSKEKHITH